MSPWLFFLFFVKWVAAVFASMTVTVAIILFLTAVVIEIRDVLL